MMEIYRYRLGYSLGLKKLLIGSSKNQCQFRGYKVNVFRVNAGVS